MQAKLNGRRGRCETARFALEGSFGEGHADGPERT